MYGHLSPYWQAFFLAMVGLQDLGGDEEQADPLTVLRAMERVEADVVALRSRIADHYAENIGNECSTQ